MALSQEKMHEMLTAMARRAGNNTCADCRRPSPTWASKNLGVFICMRCAGIHRSLGTHISEVRSISMDKWQMEWVQTMDRIGNTKANAYYEAKMPAQASLPGPTAPDEIVTEFIRRKWQQKAWFGQAKNGAAAVEAPRVLTREEERALRKQQRSMAAQGITSQPDSPVSPTSPTSPRAGMSAAYAAAQSAPAAVAAAGTAGQAIATPPANFTRQGHQSSPWVPVQQQAPVQQYLRPNHQSSPWVKPDAAVSSPPPSSAPPAMSSPPQPHPSSPPVTTSFPATQPPASHGQFPVATAQATQAMMAPDTSQAEEGFSDMFAGMSLAPAMSGADLTGPPAQATQTAATATTAQISAAPPAVEDDGPDLLDFSAVQGNRPNGAAQAAVAELDSLLGDENLFAKPGRAFKPPNKKSLLSMYEDPRAPPQLLLFPTQQQPAPFHIQNNPFPMQHAAEANHKQDLEPSQQVIEPSADSFGLGLGVTAQRGGLSSLLHGGLPDLPVDEQTTDDGGEMMPWQAQTGLSAMLNGNENNGYTDVPSSHGDPFLGMLQHNTQEEPPVSLDHTDPQTQQAYHGAFAFMQDTPAVAPPAKGDPHAYGGGGGSMFGFINHTGDTRYQAEKENTSGQNEGLPDAFQFI